MSQYDDLYGPPKSWWDGLTSEAQAWCQGLADHIAGQDREPTWSRVYAAFKDRFPDQAPTSHSTVRETVRKLIPGE